MICNLLKLSSLGLLDSLARGKLSNFSHLMQSLDDHKLLNMDKYARKLEDLLKVFNERFTQCVSESDNVALFTNPFTFPPDNLSTLDELIQLEVLDLQNNAILKARFSELHPVSTAEDIIILANATGVRIFTIASFAQSYICRFGSTCTGQAFSSMNTIKNKNELL